MHYTVKVGDTLWTIAARVCGDPERWRAIADDNGLGDQSRIMVGDQLLIRNAWATRPPRAEPVPLDRSLARGSGPQHRESLIPGRAYTFVLADEINPLTRKVVRRVLVNPRMAAELAARVGRPFPLVPRPEHYGFQPSGPEGLPVSAGQHAMNLKPSPFLSASDHAFGARRFYGSSFWIDVARARAAGATVHETSEILADLDRIAHKTHRATDLARIAQFKQLVAADREVLLRGAVPKSAVKGAAALALTRGLQGVQIVSFVITAVDLGLAASQSVARCSLTPLAAESLRQSGSWASAWGGAKLGATAGALLGIETGPGSVAFAAGGAAVGGFLGYLGFDWIADHVGAN